MNHVLPVAAHMAREPRGLPWLDYGCFFVFFRAEFKPKKIKIENDKAKGKKRKPDDDVRTLSCGYNVTIRLHSRYKPTD